MSDDTVERLREICLSLPEAHEQLAWEDHVTWRIRKKIFAMPTE
jgi:predicted DNA-binding protein (MmcQ/YjbR family)